VRRYAFHGLVGREATIRAAASAHESALVEKLRFGLAFVELTEELVSRLAGGPGGDTSTAPFIEFVRLTSSAAAWAEAASQVGPLGYVEGEFADGAGFHAGVAWRQGRKVYGPRGGEAREAVNDVMRLLGVLPSGAMDETEASGILNR
jgi:hypothetical protein